MKKRTYRSAARSSPALRRRLRSLGERIRELRVSVAEQTQEATARRAGIDAKHYQAIEAGRVNATVSSIAGIARGLGVDLRALFAP